MLIDNISQNIFFGIALTLIAYNIALLIKDVTKLAIFNPLLVSILITLAIILSLDIKVDSYMNGASYIGNLLTPTTVCLAVPLYENLIILKHYWKGIIIGIIIGVISSALTILPLAILFSLSKQDYLTLLPKSITGAFGMGASQELGGIVPVTVIIIIITGIIGSIINDYIFKMFKITHPVAKGVSLGASSHAMGTSKAFEIGATEGAISSISLIITGLLTVISISYFAGLY